MVQLSVHELGSVIAVGIEGDNPQEITEQFYSLYNLRATEGELTWLTERFAFIWSNPKKFYNYLIESNLAKLLNSGADRFRKIKHGARPQAVELAKIQLNSIKEEKFLKTSSTIPEYAVRGLDFGR